MSYTYLQATGADGRMPSSYGDQKGPIFLTVVHWDGRPQTDLTPNEIAEAAFVEHNRSNRPLGWVIRSMSVGDVVVTSDESSGEKKVLVVAPVGFNPVEGKARREIVSLATRGVPAHGALRDEAEFDYRASLKGAFDHS